MKLFVTLIVLLFPVLWTVGASAAGHGAEARQEYACGSLAAIPALVAESASLRCADGSGQQTDIETKGKQVLCMYATECSPATTRVKRKILEYLKKDDWAKLSDDEIVRAMVKLDGSAGVGALERTGMQVHCVASRTRNGNPDCPGVNECANDVTSSLIWKVSPIAMNAQPKAEDVNGLRIEKTDASAPERVAPKKSDGTKQ
ncbi:hypothetical protein BH10BDE1_BH10BDE1_25660 [soil metagenome]